MFRFVMIGLHCTCLARLAKTWQQIKIIIHKTTHVGRYFWEVSSQQVFSSISDYLYLLWALMFGVDRVVSHQNTYQQHKKATLKNHCDPRLLSSLPSVALRRLSVSFYTKSL